MENLKKLQEFIAGCKAAQFEPIVENENYYEANVVGIGTTITGMEELFEKYKSQEHIPVSERVFLSVSISNRLQVWIHKSCNMEF